MRSRYTRPMMTEGAAIRYVRTALCTFAVSVLSACVAPQPQPPAKPPPVVAPAKPSPTAQAAAARFRAVSWNDLPGWRGDDVAQAWPALLASCRVLRTREHWRRVCEAAAQLEHPDTATARAFFEQRFTPYAVASTDNGEQGLITGYYEPLLRGSRTRSARYAHPLYGVPDDLVVVELGSVYPQLKSMRLRGRVEGRKLVPYPDRVRIESGHVALEGKEIVWVDDAIDLFFLHIQGSGRVALESGETIRVGYADQNGHPYRSIGRLLVERGELVVEEASMQGIKHWIRKNPTRAPELLNSNPSYVFFREMPGGAAGPQGALGVALTPERSIAIDPRHIPLGAPMFIATTWPNSARALERLVVAQDTGGAIRGPVRADFFWGFGDAAGEQAGRMKQPLRAWLLLPSEHPLPATE